ncbi:MAG: response regulator transcription factor [Pseudomonadota bacterium]
MAEDNDDLRMVMPALIEGVAGLKCAATTANLEDVAPLIAAHQVQVAVLDIELRGGSALKRLPALCREFPGTRFIIHSGHSNPELVRMAQSAGAAAYVLKSGEFEDLLAAIRGPGC